MSKRYIVVSEQGYYLTPRRNTGSMYVNRVNWSSNLDDAKVFNTKAAASNSGNQSGAKYELKTVRLVIE